ncbi:MAG: chemotaxis response regulator protein-glutamate methylesterase [Actinobacteria bacterium]|nr:chemotaxis response regulator protein-glutamate methylesterase [Actinomycetota bacterium]
MNGQAIAVFIVDDSAVVRQVLTTQLGADPAIEVLGAAADPIFALDKMQRSWPDVIVLDLEMPRMDGISFLRQIMATHPTPVVICSTMTQRGAETTVEALAAGAVSVVPKPMLGIKKYLEDESADIVAAVKAAAAGRAVPLRGSSTDPESSSARSRAAVGAARAATAAMASTVPGHSGPLTLTTDRVVAIGTSTGGTQALEVVLTAVPVGGAGIVVVQHMPEKFTAAFAARLDGLCALEVKEAVDGDRVLSGRVLIAPGGLHMELRRDGAHYRVAVFDGPPVNRHRPSVDVLFRSVAHCAGRNALGVILTGMGDDGARGLLEMHAAGASTLGQDEATCVVYGMPHEAVRLGAVDREVPLHEVAGVIRSHG